MRKWVEAREGNSKQRRKRDRGEAKQEGKEGGAAGFSWRVEKCKVNF